MKLAPYLARYLLTEKQIIKTIGAKFRACVSPEGNERFCRIIRDLIPCKLTPDLFVSASVRLWTTLGARHQNVHVDFGGEIIYMAFVTDQILAKLLVKLIAYSYVLI